MPLIGKTALVKDIATSLGFTQTAVDDILTSLTDAIRAHTAKGDAVNIAGLGRFAVKTRPARTGRNPRTGEAVDIPQKRVLVFRPAAKAAE